MNHRRALAGLFAFLVLTSFSAAYAADEPADKPNEQAAQHLWLDPDLRKNIEFVYFESGHMVYVSRTHSPP